MGIDITLYAGIGVHIPRSYLEPWWDREDPDDELGFWEVLQRTLIRGYPHLDFASPNNFYSDIKEFERGVVIYVNRVTGSFDMGRYAEAGVFRPSYQAITLEERSELNRISVEIAGPHRAYRRG